MNLKVFKADTMAQALAQVKNTMGSEAVILHTRTYQQRKWMGLRRHEVVEITAGKGLNVRPRTRRPAPAGQCMPPAWEADRPVTNRSPGKALLESPAVSVAMLTGINHEMAQLKVMMKGLVVQTQKSQAPQIPEELFEYYTHLIENQVAQELAADVVRTLQQQLRPEHFQNHSFVRDKLAEIIEKMIPTAGPIHRTKTTGPHVVALIGPTGVGKTTTIAKLAANLKLREKHRVGLITIDTYRIAAIDQLRKYAEIIGSPLRVVSTAEDLKEAIRAMNDCEYILIDTAGRSPNDTLKLNELKGFLAAVSPDEVHLVLSSTASQECVELAIDRFSEIRVDRIIFTKLDEAAHVGVVLNVVKKVNKALSYVTTGQDVPDDIEIGRGGRLARMIMGGAL